MTRPFRFTLDQVLDYRGQLEDQAKLALSKALAAENDQRAVCASLSASLAEHEARFLENPSMTAADIWLWRGYKDRLDADLAVAHTNLSRLVQATAARRAELVEKAKQRKLLEKLKEKKATRHADEEQRKEQAQFDEQATLRFRPASV
ncbi:flagellar export protein FliJ [Fundidesulfovibrio butyratiphilus]